jgi:hypothetical protein
MKYRGVMEGAATPFPITSFMFVRETIALTVYGFPGVIWLFLPQRVCFRSTSIFVNAIFQFWSPFGLQLR